MNNSVKTLIAANPEIGLPFPSEPYLEVAEFFSHTIQGEGVSVGVPAVFLRLQHCTQNCVWCDSKEVWRYGNPYTFDQLFSIMEEQGVFDYLKQGAHFIVTGGSPLRQQAMLLPFLQILKNRIPDCYIEIENECTLMPYPNMISTVSQWNNSPKLSNSGNSMAFRYQPKILSCMAGLMNSWFKFVIASEDDWLEIKTKYLDTGILNRSQILLMPLGADRSELNKNRSTAVKIALREGVRFSDRLHVVIWDKKTGV